MELEDLYSSEAVSSTESLSGLLQQVVDKPYETTKDIVIKIARASKKPGTLLLLDEHTITTYTMDISPQIASEIAFRIKCLENGLNPENYEKSEYSISKDFFDSFALVDPDGTSTNITAEFGEIILTPDFIITFRSILPNRGHPYKGYELTSTINKFGNGKLIAWVPKGKSILELVTFKETIKNLNLSTAADTNQELWQDYVRQFNLNHLKTKEDVIKWLEKEIESSKITSSRTPTIYIEALEALKVDSEI
jgi:hypothetical protein